MEERKNANGAGSIRRRDTVLEVRWHSENGRHSKSFPATKVGEKEAKKFLRALPDIAPVYEPRLTLGDWSTRWYVDLKDKVREGKLEESTYIGYQYTLALIKAQWGDALLSDVTAEDIDKGLDNIKKKIIKKDANGKVSVTEAPYSFGIYKKIKVMLGQIFHAAVKARKIQRSDNPLLDVEELRDNERKPASKDGYSEADLIQLLTSLPDDKYGHAIRVCVACGLRGQELLPLTVADVEPDGSVIALNKALKRGVTPYLGKTKTKSSNRIVYVPEFAQASLRWLREHSVNGYILPNKLGGFVKYRSYLTGYRAAVEKAGVAPLPPHCTRHTYTTNMLLKVGAKDLVVMASTGHADRRTMEGYAHAHAEDGIAAAGKYNEYIENIMRKNKGSSHL
jgi:integrase